MAEKEEKKGFFQRLFKKEAKPEKPKEPKLLEKIDKNIKISSKEVEPEFRLWLSDGRVIKSITELARAMQDMKKEAYSYHVSGEKNDFANWIKDVLKEKWAAEQLRKAKSQQEAAQLLSSYLPKAAKKPRAITQMQARSKPGAKRKKAEKLRVIKKPAKQPEPTKTKAAKKPQARIKPITIKPKLEKPADSLRRKEVELMEKERGLNDEEKRLNDKRLGLSKKRYELVKIRAEIERERFEQFLKEEGAEETPAPSRIVEVPMHLESPSKEEIEKLIARAKNAVRSNNVQEAKRSLEEAKDLFEQTFLMEDERKRIQYEILEVETDVKLATLD